MKREQLQAQSKTDLIRLARQQGIVGWHGMRKEALIDALLVVPLRRRRFGTAPAAVLPQTAAARATSAPQGAEDEAVDHASGPSAARPPREPSVGYGKDRVALAARDPYWLHVSWELTRQAVQRAEAALAQDWHTARPTLRLLEVVDNEGSYPAATFLRDVPIHGGGNNWYLEVDRPPRSFRVDIGYLDRGGRFYTLARSNVAATPRAGRSDAIDANWADADSDGRLADLEICQLLNERLRRPLGASTVGGFSWSHARTFAFELDADLIVYGRSEPHARVTLQGEPIHLRPDGSFTVRYRLPDSRQIIPAVATSPDGVEERTIVLAVERNTKRLEPMIHENE